VTFQVLVATVPVLLTGMVATKPLPHWLVDVEAGRAPGSARTRAWFAVGVGVGEAVCVGVGVGVTVGWATRMSGRRETVWLAVAVVSASCRCRRGVWLAVAVGVGSA